MYHALQKVPRTLLIILVIAALLMPGILSAETNEPSGTGTITSVTNLPTVVPAQTATVTWTTNVQSGCMQSAGAYYAVTASGGGSLASMSISFAAVTANGFSIVTQATETVNTSMIGFTVTRNPVDAPYNATAATMTFSASTPGVYTFTPVAGDGSHIPGMICGVGAEFGAPTTPFSITIKENTVNFTIINDLDADGVKDAGEPALTGVTVLVAESGGPVVATLTDPTSYKLPKATTYDIVMLATPPFLPINPAPAEFTVTPGGNLNIQALFSASTAVTGNVSELLYTLAVYNVHLVVQPAVGSPAPECEFDTTLDSLGNLGTKIPNTCTGQVVLTNPNFGTMYYQANDGNATQNPSTPVAFGGVKVCPDINGNGLTDAGDSSKVLQNWGLSGSTTLGNFFLDATLSPNVDIRDLNDTAWSIFHVCDPTHEVAPAGCPGCLALRQTVEIMSSPHYDPTNSFHVEFSKRNDGLFDVKVSGKPHAINNPETLDVIEAVTVEAVRMVLGNTGRWELGPQPQNVAPIMQSLSVSTIENQDVNQAYYEWHMAGYIPDPTRSDGRVHKPYPEDTWTLLGTLVWTPDTNGPQCPSIMPVTRTSTPITGTEVNGVAKKSLVHDRLFTQAGVEPTGALFDAVVLSFNGNGCTIDGEGIKNPPLRVRYNYLPSVAR